MVDQDTLSVWNADGLDSLFITNLAVCEPEPHVDVEWLVLLVDRIKLNYSIISSLSVRELLNFLLDILLHLESLVLVGLELVDFLSLQIDETDPLSVHNEHEGILLEVKHEVRLHVVQEALEVRFGSVQAHQSESV